MKIILKALFFLLMAIIPIGAIIVGLNYDAIKRVAIRGEHYQYSNTFCEGNSTTSIDANYSKSASISKARLQLDSLKDNYRIPGLAICVIQNGQIIWNEGLGCADIENQLPVTTNTQFRIGSISKSLTAIGLATLYEKGSLNWNAAVRKYLPSLPPDLDQIKLTQFAGHQSGVRHYKGLEMLSNRTFSSVDESMEVFINDPLSFKPGSAYSYSSYNYTILSKVIEQLSGLFFLEFMEQAVFQPLNMEFTEPDGIDRQLVTYSSGPGKNKISHAVEVNLSNKWAGGGFISTPMDIATMMRDLSKLISNETQNLLFESQSLDDGTKTDYGIGFRKTYVEKYNKTIIHHGGSSIGGRAFLLKILEDDLIIAICANSDSGIINPQNYDLNDVFQIAKCFFEDQG